MIPIPSRVRVWIATGHTDMRRGMNSLALLVQEAFKRDPHGGDLYVFRGKSGDHTSFCIPIAICCRSLSLASAVWGAAARSPAIRTTG
jgi:transposase